jgi:hypothetical protein
MLTVNKRTDLDSPGRCEGFLIEAWLLGATLFVLRPARAVLIRLCWCSHQTVIDPVIIRVARGETRGHATCLSLASCQSVALRCWRS